MDVGLLRTSIIYKFVAPPLFFLKQQLSHARDPAARMGPWYFLSRKMMWLNEEDERTTKRRLTLTS